MAGNKCSYSFKMIAFIFKLPSFNVVLEPMYFINLFENLLIFCQTDILSTDILSNNSKIFVFETISNKWNFFNWVHMNEVY